MPNGEAGRRHGALSPVRGGAPTRSVPRRAGGAALMALPALLLWPAAWRALAALLSGAAARSRELAADRSRSEEARRVSEGRLAAIIESAMDAVITIDEDQRVVVFNRAAEQMFRCPAAEALGRPLDRFIPAGARAAHREYVRAFAATARTARRMGALGAVRGVRADGEEFPVEAAISAMDTGRGRLLTVVLRDVSERMAAEEALRRSERRFRALADAIPQIVFAAGPDGSTEYLNRVWGEYTGLAAEEGLGDGWRSVPVHPDDVARAGEAWGRAVEGAEPFEAEVRIRRASDGAWRWHLARAQPLLDAEGKVERWFGTCTDIHDGREALTVLREADRRKDEFLAMLGHEVRNPLAAIVNALQVLDRAPESDTMARRHREVIGRQVRHLSRLVEDLLDLSRIRSGKIALRLERLDLREALERACEGHRPAAEGRRQSLTVALPGEPLPVDGDGARLEQVVGNLVQNAVKYTPPGGRIHVSAEAVEGRAVVRVRDDGQGIEPGNLAGIFDPFVQEERSAGQSRAGGMGLGLPLVRRLVEMHGGEVSARSEGRDRGSEFSVWLPLREGLPIPEEEPGGAVPAEPRRVLVVEDNPDSRTTLQDLLTLEGHEVEVAEDGLQGVERALAWSPDVALVDIDLPVLDGYEVARRLRREPRGRAVRLVALTGYGLAGHREKAREAGFDAFVVKPVDLGELRRLIASAPRGIPGEGRGDGAEGTPGVPPTRG